MTNLYIAAVALLGASCTSKVQWLSDAPEEANGAQQEPYKTKSIPSTKVLPSGIGPAPRPNSPLTSTSFATEAEATPWRPTPRVLSDDTVFIGDVAYTRQDNVFVATSKGAYDRLLDLILAQDLDGIQAMAVFGILWIAPSFAPFRVIKDYGWINRYYEVRVLEGPHKGSIGFVSASDIRKAR